MSDIYIARLCIKSKEALFKTDDPIYRGVFVNALSIAPFLTSED